MSFEAYGPGGNGPRPSRAGLSLSWPRTIYLLLVVIVLTSGLTIAATNWYLRVQFRALNVAAGLENEPNFYKLFQVIDLANRRYVEPDDATADRLLEGAIAGAVEALGDRYSMYYDASQFAGVRRQMEGEYSGIGTVVTSVDGYVTIISPFRGAPADTATFEGAGPGDRAGLQPGDRIKAVDGDDIVGMPLEQAVELILGPAGSEVTLSVLREGHATPLIFTITRARVQIPMAEGEMLPDNVGYLHVLQFTDGTLVQVKDALRSLEDEGMEALVLDLRNNGGGTLSSVEEVSGLFVPRGPIVHIDDREGKRETLHSPGPGLSVPMVVLINGGTASGAEILAGAIRDYQLADLVGIKSFGKGSVQNVWPLDEMTGLKVTVARYLTPNEYSIDQEGGLMPDHVVEMPAEAEFANLDTDQQLQEAYRLVRELLGR